MSHAAIHRLVLCCLAVATSAGSADAQSGRPAPAPLNARDGLFDQSRPTTLGLPVVPGKHALVYRATRNGYKFCHHANLGIWRDRLYLMWSNGVEHEDHNGQRVLYCWTADGNQWTKPTVLAADPDGDGPLACVAAGFHATKDTLVAYYSAVPEGKPGSDPRNTLFSMTSRDGRKWSKPREMAQGFYIEGPRRLLGGRLLMNGQWPRRQPRLRYTDSADGVQGWRDGAIPEIPGVFSFPEPSWFVRRDRAITMIFRTKSGDFGLYASESRDQGKTWSKPARTNFPDATARSFAGNLPDGSAFIISNPATRPSKTHPSIGRRNPLTIALSNDGVTFDRAFAIRAEPTEMRFPGKNKVHGWQYPAAIVWRGHLFVAYSINKEDVGVTRIRLQDLQAKSAK